MSSAIVARSATVEQGLVVLAAVLAGLLGWRAMRRREAPAPDVDAPFPLAAELAALVVIVAFAVAVRVLAWNDHATPVLWFSEMPQLHVAAMREDGALWSVWTKLLRSYQGIWAHDSAIGLPAFAVLQRVLGPSFGLPVLVGACFAVPSVVLAWLLGRALRSPAFGLLFAAFVACSPLQMTWSRLGGFYIAASAHVLLALLCAYHAGRTRSITATVLAALVAWTSLYGYFAARAAIPLAGAALLRGTQDGSVPWPRRVGLALVFVATIAGVLLGLEGGGFRQTFWPSYAGYVGNRGEASMAAAVLDNLHELRVQAGESLARFFTRTRTTHIDAAWTWGMAYGGLTLAPVTLLGGMGLAAALRRFRRDWLWLLLLAIGLAIPSLSVPSARRFLVMDLAWCGLAAHGLLALASVLGRGMGRPLVATLLCGVTAGVALWSAVTLFALGAALPAGGGQPIPFGESGFMDGIACKRCVDAARGWQREIADGAFVVLFDSDLSREDRTSPGGLPSYGKLAALAAGAPDRFVAGYALLGNYDIEPPAIGPLYDQTSTTFADVLRDQVEDTTPDRIVWHFERPTPWEQWLARRLVAAGGAIELFDTPLAAGGLGRGLRVVTPRAQRDAALEVFRTLADDSTAGGEPGCVRLAERAVTEAPLPVLVLAAPRDTGALPRWTMGSYQQLWTPDARLDLLSPVAAAVDATPAGGARVDVLNAFGQRTLIGPRTGERSGQPPAPGLRYGLDCATRIGEHWWVVNIISGRLTSPDPDGSWVPPGPWMGITRGPDDELILAAADQRIVVLDVARRREIARFPAVVSPSRRAATDDCAMIAAGRGWIATLNDLDSVLRVYGARGRLLGAVPANRALSLPVLRFSAMASDGRHLGLGAGAEVKTVEPVVDPECARRVNEGPARRES